MVRRSSDPGNGSSFRRDIVTIDPRISRLWQVVGFGDAEGVQTAIKDWTIKDWTSPRPRPLLPLPSLPPSPRPRPPLPLPSLPPPPRPRPPLRSPLPSRWAAPSARSAKLLWRQPPPFKPLKCGAVSRLYGPTSAATPAATCDTGGGSAALLAACTTGRLLGLALISP